MHPGRRPDGNDTATASRSRLCSVAGSALAGTAVLLCATSCGSGSDSGSASSPDLTSSSPTYAESSAPTQGAPGSPSASATGSPGAGSSADPLGGFRRRCLEQTLKLDEAGVYFAPRVQTTIGTPYRFRAELRPRTPAGDASGEVKNQGTVGLACTVKARLLGPDALHVTPAGWVDQKYVPPARTSWVWVVSPSAPGSVAAELQLTPVVRIRSKDGHMSQTDLTTTNFDVGFVVAPSSPSPRAGPNGPAKDTPATKHRSWFGSTAHFVATSWAGLVSFATGLTAIVGAVIAVRRLSSRKSRAEGAADAEEDVPKDQAADA